jgi:hypothetical protein
MRAVSLKYGNHTGKWDKALHDVIEKKQVSNELQKSSKNLSH